MNFSKYFSEAGVWLDGTGPQSDIVLSSRIRLARNISGYLFFAHADNQQREEVHEFVRQQIMNSELKKRLSFFNMDDISPLERQILAERHLISRQLAQGQGSRGVAVARDEQISLMINEEDHLRIQAISSGLQLYETFEMINQIDDLLEKTMPFSFSPQYGYLTACPTNVGTGIRVSVMLHLPALKMTEQIDKALRAAKDMGLAIRGLYGEGSEPVGDFFQLSNQITLGKSEKQIIDELIERAVNPITDYERRARLLLFEEKRNFLDDKIFRALGVLTNARMISSEEAMYLLSYVRLGIYLERIKDITLNATNRLFLLIQPGHLQNLCHESLDSRGRDEQRANLIRKELGGVA
jgi:protein arginine kinase